MLKMVNLIFHLLVLFSWSFIGEGQKSVQLLNFHEGSSHSSHSVAVAVNAGEITKVSGSVAMAESWLRTHVLAHYPASPITTIVVGGPVLCSKEEDYNLGLVLPALKNIHHSLQRWGLEKEIKVSAALSSGCLNQNSGSEKLVRPLMEFLQGTNSTYLVHPPPKFAPLPKETAKLVSFHSEGLKKLGFWGFSKINVVLRNPNESKPKSRKLSGLVVDPFPARPTPLPEISESPLHSSIGFSVPANVAKNPNSPQPQVATPPLQLPSPQPQTPKNPNPPQAQTPSPSPMSFSAAPQAQTASPSPLSFSAAPENPPSAVQSPQTPPFADQSPPNPPFVDQSPLISPVGYQAPPSTLPPCKPTRKAQAPAPETMAVHNKLWCVAKPTVPSDTLQEAMDYACGEGGADCTEIMQDGNCYSPDSVVAHASYAFNSYWQMNKKSGGTCTFGGTAMLINTDPSYLHCRFILT